MPRILVIVPFPAGHAGVERCRRQLEAVELEPDSEFHYRPVKAGPPSAASPCEAALADLAVFEAGCDAEAEGYDAVCIDSMNDSGMAALRSVLDIPVLSPGRVSVLFALMLGSRFSILARSKPAISSHRKALGTWGLLDHCASIRSLDGAPDVEALADGKDDQAYPEMLDLAGRCVEEDGADVVILGSTAMHPAAGWLATRLPVPLINPGPLTYKLAESLLALKLSHSRACHPRPAAPRAAMVHAMLAAAARVTRSPG